MTTNPVEVLTDEILDALANGIGTGVSEEEVAVVLSIALKGLPLLYINHAKWSAIWLTCSEAGQLAAACGCRSFAEATQLDRKLNSLGALDVQAKKNRT